MPYTLVIDSFDVKSANYFKKLLKDCDYTFHNSIHYFTISDDIINDVKNEVLNLNNFMCIEDGCYLSHIGSYFCGDKTGTGAFKILENYYNEKSIVKQLEIASCIKNHCLFIDEETGNVYPYSIFSIDEQSNKIWLSRDFIKSISVILYKKV